jgi:Ca-activated chloride channel homolog
MKISRAMVLSMLLAGSAQASAWSAELQSGQYAAAAKRLEPFADAGSQYNRGNALANSGDLQGALNAYDGALKHADLESSLRRDAEHNRDLVARQLQAQKDQPHASSGQQPPPKGKEDGNARGNESKEGSGDSGSSSPSQGDNNGKPTTTPALPSSPIQANGTPQTAQDQNASSTEASQQQAAEQQEMVGRQEPSPRSGSRSGTEQLDARKAALDDPALPQTEQQLALEQWLRQIPDDPGGLLRRKFMIEHLMKQQQVQP